MRLTKRGTQVKGYQWAEKRCCVSAASLCGLRRDGEAFTGPASLWDGILTVWTKKGSKTSPVGIRSAAVVGTMLLESNR